MIKFCKNPDHRMSSRSLLGYWKTTIACILLLGACSQPQDSLPATVLAESIVKKKLDLLDKKHTEVEVCDDYDLARMLLSTIQGNSFFRSEFLNESRCPESFSSFAEWLKASVRSTGDLHVRARIGYGLDAKVSPVVESCEGVDRTCDSLIGSPLLPVSTSIEYTLYVAVVGTDSTIRILEVMSLNADSPMAYMPSLIAGRYRSHSRSGTVTDYSELLFERELWDGRPLESYKLVARDIRTQEEILLGASFETRQSIFPTTEQLTFIEQINAPSYNCDKVSQGSTDTLGLCVTQNAMPTLWLKSFLDHNGTDATLPVPLLRDLLPPTDASRQNHGVIDLRGNRGGSTDMALRFLCQIGDESIVSKLAQLEYHLSIWPRSMTTRRGTIIDLEHLAKSNNTDLIRFSEEITSDDLSTQVGSTALRLGVLERFGLDRESCRALHSIAASGYRWTVLTRGDEFSAAETFLYGLKGAHRFTVVGMTTRGGTGNPIWVELPNTKILLRLSVARMFDRQRGEEIIEKKGVTPDRVHVDVLKEEFEARAVLSLTNKIPPLVTDMVYETILKKIYRKIK